MNSEKFNTVVRSTAESIVNILATKAKEYSVNDDRLHNFNQMARVNEKTVEETIWGMASKHLSCILDMVNGSTKPTEYLVNEKIGDMINYLVILKAHLLNEISLPKPYIKED